MNKAETLQKLKEANTSLQAHFEKAELLIPPHKELYRVRDESAALIRALCEVLSARYFTVRVVMEFEREKSVLYAFHQPLKVEFSEADGIGSLERKLQQAELLLKNVEYPTFECLRAFVTGFLAGTHFTHERLTKERDELREQLRRFSASSFPGFPMWELWGEGPRFRSR